MKIGKLTGRIISFTDELPLFIEARLLVQPIRSIGVIIKQLGYIPITVGGHVSPTEMIGMDYWLVAFVLELETVAISSPLAKTCFTDVALPLVMLRTKRNLERQSKTSGLVVLFWDFCPS